MAAVLKLAPFSPMLFILTSTLWGSEFLLKWAWVKIKPPGIGPQVLVLSIYQSSILCTYF